MQPVQIAVVPVTPFAQNCSIVWCTKSMKGVVIDPGGDLERVRAAIAETGAQIEKILLTHGHVDHAAGAAELAESLKVPVEGPHAADQFLLDDIPRMATKYGFEGGGRALTPDRYLAEGDPLAIGELEVEILHVPGHTPGHLVYVLKNEKIAIVGDTLFRGSVGRTDFPYGDHAQLIEAITRKLLPLGPAVVCLPGHGALTSIGDEAAHNPFLNP